MTGISKYFIFTLVFISSFFLPIEDAKAHPHVFVDCELTYVFDKSGLTGIRQDWIFDEMFASMILGEHDKNHDLKISPKEEKSIYNGAFVNLKNFNYFNHFSLNGKEISVNEAQDFKAFVKDGLLHYDFFIPCKIKFDGKKHRLLTAVYDKSYYTAMLLSPKNKLSNVPAGKKVTLDFDSIKELSYYYGQVVPDGTILTILP